MIILYKDGDRKEVNPIDASGWVKNGWQPDGSERTRRPTADDKSARLNTVDSITSDELAPIFINKATAEEISANVPGVGTTRAKTIVNARPFKDINEAESKLPRIDWSAIAHFISFDL